ARQLPVMPGEDGPWAERARRADALVQLCCSASGSTGGAGTTLIVHAPLGALTRNESGCELEGGGVIHPETARRLGCEARVQVQIEDEHAQPLRLGRAVREPPAWMARQLRHRDGECRFPGCGRRQHTHAHHIVWWMHGGRTDLDNLVLLCGAHHKLVHEFGWRLRRERDGTVAWFRPNGLRYRAGPAPPSEPAPPTEPAPSTAVEERARFALATA
ncbi:MAG TPA: DUF222 domain-containing protein, partial [Actinomycetota bacterium]